MRRFSTIQPLVGLMRRAIDKYDMISEGERIAVGVSGGKDSLTLLCALRLLSEFHPKHFTVTAITLDTGLPGADLAPIRRLCEETETELIVSEYEIYKIVFEIRREKNPCSLCANLRRGALNSVAVENGIRKIALGHHKDDAVETFFMNLYNEGRIGCFSPVTHLDRKDITVIRPLVFAPESQVSAACKRNDLEVVKSVCPADKTTVRQQTKEFLADMESRDRGVKQRRKVTSDFGLKERERKEKGD